MKSNFFKTMSVVGMFLLLASACSNKTKNVEQTRDAQQQQQAREPQGQGRGNGQERPQGGGDGQQRRGRPEFADLLAKMDANKDGKLSKEEANGPLKDNFSKIDTDGDGFISAEEFKNAPPPPQRN